jgi:zinc/manganese transport system substrate-binding protein
VHVEALVGANGDAHVYEPTPADARSVAEADLVVVNGLGFEGWLDRLVEASGFTGHVLVASEGVEALAVDEKQPGIPEEQIGHDAAAHHRGVNPHAWQSLADAVIYVRNISGALCTIDPAGCGEYQANASSYVTELRQLDETIRADFAAIPKERRIVITSHDAFDYFGRAYDITFLPVQGVSTESEASAADLAALIQQIRRAGATGLFVENISDPRLIEQIARETDVRPGGSLFSDALSEADGPASDYLSMMRHNADLLLAAMAGDHSELK